MKSAFSAGLNSEPIHGLPRLLSCCSRDLSLLLRASTLTCLHWPAPAEVREPADRPPAPAFVRLWNFNSDSGLVLSKDPGPSEPLLETPAECVSAEYAPFPAGYHTLGLGPDSGSDFPALRIALSLAPGNFVTLLASAQKNSISVHLLDETPPRVPQLTGELTVRPFVPGALLRLRTAEQPECPLLAYREARVLKGFPRGLTTLHLQAKFPELPAVEWILQADFTECPRQTLLVTLDPYGRLRPRLAPLGQPHLHTPPAEEMPP